jgi:hypothetical protein
MNNYEVIRKSILMGKISRISQILQHGTPAFWSRILNIPEIRARNKIKKKGATLILKDAYALATFFKVDIQLIIDLINKQQQHSKERKS